MSRPRSLSTLSSNFDQSTVGENKGLVSGARTCEAVDTENWKRQIIGARWWRDAVLFAVGAVVVSALLLCGGAVTQVGGNSGPTPPCLAGQASGAELDASWASTWSSQGSAVNEGSPSSATAEFAFVQLAYDAPHDPPYQVWKALAMARALQRVSRYPLILLTNFTRFINGTRWATRLQRVNVQVLPIHEVRAPEAVVDKLTPVERIAYWKLQVWRLTQFKRLILLDTDAILVRSIDWLFERGPVWGQRESRDCSFPKAVSGEDRGSLNTGLLLIEPSEQTYKDIQQYSGSLASEWWIRGFSALIEDYFEHAAHTPVKLLDPLVASSGMCLGKVPNLPYDKRGPWNLPAFVHKSSLKNECFFLDRRAQLQRVDGRRVNVCHYHPLGTWWRSLFCGAINITEIHDPIAADFCDDSTWYSAGAS